MTESEKGVVRPYRGTIFTSSSQCLMLLFFEAVITKVLVRLLSRRVPWFSHIHSVRGPPLIGINGKKPPEWALRSEQSMQKLHINTAHFGVLYLGYSIQNSHMGALVELLSIGHG